MTQRTVVQMRKALHLVKTRPKGVESRTGVQRSMLAMCLMIGVFERLFAIDVLSQLLGQHPSGTWDTCRVMGFEPVSSTFWFCGI